MAGGKNLHVKAGNVAAMELGLDDGMLELRRLAGEDASPALDPGLLKGVIKTPDRKEAPGDSWLAKGLPGQSADKAAIHGFLDALASLRAQSFTNQTMPNLKDFGLDKPKRSWVLRGSTGGAMASPRPCGC